MRDADDYDENSSTLLEAHDLIRKSGASHVTMHAFNVGVFAHLTSVDRSLLIDDHADDHHLLPCLSRARLRELVDQSASVGLVGPTLLSFQLRRGPSALID